MTLNKKDICILVVEDEDDLRQAITDYLEMHGARVFTAKGSKSALSLLKETHIDLIISDVFMPEGSGEELLELMKSEIPREIPVLLISGYSDIDVDLLIKAGAAGVLQKPFHPQKILEYINCLKDHSNTHKS
jgi:two-component system response regulator FlrC